MKKTSRNLLIPNIPKKKLLAYTLIAAAALAVFLFLWLWNSSHPVDYLIYDSQTISYDKGKVVEVLNEELQKENDTSGRMLGTQKILVQMTSGAQKGRQIEINNVLSTAHNIPLSPGDSIIVKVDAPENAEPFYSVYNYDRTGGTILISIIFLLFLVFVGKSKGLRSALGIAFTLLLILFGLLPMLYHGYSPVLCCFGTILLTSTVCLSLLSGITQRTLINLASVLLGTGAVSLFYLLFTALLNLSGYNYEEAEELLVVSQNTGLGIGELLFVGVMVSSLGAVMDMTMSLSSPLFEMKSLKPEIKARELIDSGFRIGRDMSGTMSQTLILAFIGSSLTAMLVLRSYGVHFNQFLSSDYMAIEILHGIIGGLSVILSIPVTVLLSTWFLCKHGAPSRKERYS